MSVAADRARPYTISVGSVAGYCNNTGLREFWRALQAAAYLEPIKSRQADIEEDNFRLEFPRYIKRDIPINSVIDLVSLLSQNERKRANSIEVVFYDEDSATCLWH
jgi:hypothetical protein